MDSLVDKEVNVYNFIIEVHTVNRVYVSKIYTKDSYIIYKNEDFNKAFWAIYDKSRRVKTLSEDFPIFLHDKEIFINPVNIEFIEIFKNVDPKKMVKEGVYYISEYPYKKQYR